MATSYQIPRFLVVGGVNFFFTFAVFTISLKLLELPYAVALLAAWFLGNILTYVLNFLWVFKPETRLTFRARFAKYLTAGAASILLNLAGLAALVELAGADPFWAQVALMPFIVVFNFATAKWWSLRSGGSKP
ncbi:MAG: GtrA family protein [Rhodobacteraceae bacterium]|nr:GtrA family protein [Paracoccaceae bacterium]